MLGLLLAAVLGVAPAAAAAPRDAWEATLERVVPAVVVLRTSATRPFDTEPTSAPIATGFVVDAEHGIILTNRHVVHPGPLVAEAVFSNHEEVTVHALYRDPVHDFGFLRYDPDDVRFMPPAELALAPEQARVGTEVRVVGNDAGEKLAILTGTLARLDREAPRYGRGRYNDFNTFYFQAASNTSGGSSGSPVVDVSGRVVALNAGGRSRSAASYYLPLDRVQRALELLREGREVRRGSIQTVLVHRPYDELRRLGLRPQTEEAARLAASEATGMLVVSETVPGGPGHGVLEPGDVLIRIQGKRVTSFLATEAAFDDHVGQEIALEVERGGEPLLLRVRVEDLHAITPDTYLEVGGAVLHPLSYQQARNYSLPAGQVYVASTGYMLSRAEIPSRAVITAVNGEPTPDLDAFESVASRLPDGSRVPVRYFRLGDPRTEVVAVVTVDRRWHTMQRCVRDDTTGRWPCTLSPAPPPAPEAPVATTRFPSHEDDRARKLAPSLVLVEFRLPYRLDGVQGDRFVGTGLVVDAERGLVVVDRDTVPVALGDATLTFGGSIEVPAEVVTLHPLHNLALLRYDPVRLGETPMRSAELRYQELTPGEEIWVVGLTPSHQVLTESTRISQVNSPTLSLPRAPRFRETNVDLVTVVHSPPTVGGVLADRRGRVLAFWGSFSTQDGNDTRSFFAGIPSELLDEIVEPARRDQAPTWRSLEVELVPLSLADARNRGLSDSAARILEEHDPKRRQVLSVRRLTAGAPASVLLREGDLLLSIDGQPVTRSREVERAVPEASVSVTLLRDGEELTLEVPTSRLDGRGTERAVVWAGALLQAPHRALAAQRGIPRQGVYVAWRWYGSPSDRYKLGATRRIVAVDGIPTPDIDTFLATVAHKPDRGSVRLKTLDLEGRVKVITLKLDLQYWPTFELRRAQTGWERIALPVPSQGDAPRRAEVPGAPG